MRTLWPFALLAACGGTKVTGPETGGSDSSTDTHNQDSVPPDTGWPVVDGEDFAVVDVEAGELRAYWNEGGAISPTSSTTASLPYTDATYLLCDFDGDGLDDLWVAEPTGSVFRLEVYVNQGGIWAGTASYSGSVTLNRANFTLACGDFNGDGRADFAAFRLDNQKMCLYPNEGGTFDFTATNKTSSGLSAAATWLAGDVDGDGTDELIGVDGTAMTVFPVTGGTALGTPLFTDTLPTGYAFALLDLTPDGRSDLALWNGAALVVRPSTGTAFDSASAQTFTVRDTGLPLGGNLR